MGFDIYGAPRVPWLKKPKEIVANSYEEIMWQISTGRYFRSGGGSWEPIYHLIEKANSVYGLNLDLEYWNSNDDEGLSNPEDCTKLADAMVKLIADKQYTDIKNFDIEDAAYFIQFLYNTCAFTIS